MPTETNSTETNPFDQFTETSPLNEADPNSLDELLTQRIGKIFNTPPLDLTNSDISDVVLYYRRERSRFLNDAKQVKPGRKRKTPPTSVAEALAMSDDVEI